MTDRDTAETRDATPGAVVPEDEQEHPSLLRTIVETAVTIALAWILALGVRTYIAEGYKTPTGSMFPTIETTDWILFSKITYRFGSPQPGDIVTLDDPYKQMPMLMKRVIAVGGQTVDVRDGKVWVDGVPLDEPYTHGKPSEPARPGSGRGVTVTLPITLAEGDVWVMGDNRTNSQDSRWFGPVPVSTVHAKAIFIYWPPPRWGVPR